MAQPKSGPRRRVCVIGAGVGGLTAAIELAVAGHEVEVLEAASEPGGKMRQVVVAGQPIDCGPTVLTMHWVFEELFARAGTSLADHVRLVPAEILARHAWQDGGTLDLFADLERSVDAIGTFASAHDARGYRAFVEHTTKIYDAVAGPFLLGQRPSLWSMMTSPTVRQLSPLAVDAHRSMIRSLASFFDDPRLVQMFGRYATYVGSSPFEAPGTLSLIAHVERKGVHYVEGGMAKLSAALANLAAARGVQIRYGAKVEHVETERDSVRSVRSTYGEHRADVVVYAGDVAALGRGLLGESVRKAVDYDFAPARRSLSALTLSAVTRASGFPLVRHNVFFGADTKAEFEDLFVRRSVPRAPTVYVCAQDRSDAPPANADFERLFFIINAPADADVHTLSPEEIQTCENSMNTLLAHSNLTLEHRAQTWMTPSELEARFPGSAGAIYGRTSHGMLAALKRPSARTRVRGLYLAGGTVHPGAGVPMAALSGSAAAQAIGSDLGSTARSKTAATAGSTSTA